jgi:hypothetical protein
MLGFVIVTQKKNQISCALLPTILAPVLNNDLILWLVIILVIPFFVAVTLDHVPCSF